MARPQEVIAKLASLTGKDERQEFLRRRSEIVDSALVKEVCSEVARLVWVDLEKAHDLAETARFMAELLGDDRCRALSARAAANAQHFSGENEKARELYRLSIELFEKVGDVKEAAVTRSSGMHSLAYLGEYEKVEKWESDARAVFERFDDRLRLAGLENNSANILYRRDRWEDALKSYARAHDEFVQLKRSHDAAVCLHNIAVCHISLHNFGEALAAYNKNRAFCLEQGLDRLVLQVDYNIAYLHYLRGEYTRAIHLYREARRGCEAGGDDYHRALCDLDQAEIFLELNMVDEAATLARSAIAGFGELRLPYESAKALTASAIALSRQGNFSLALEQLTEARGIFVKEKNELWPALIDFYRAVVLYRERRPEKAMRLARGARESFLKSALAPKAAMCELLQAELYLDLERPQDARRTCEEALARLSELELPALEHQAHLVLGRIEESLGDRKAALEAYRQSHEWLEKLCSQLQGEELKIAFLGDKLAVYESLVWLIMQDPMIEDRKAATFEFIEQSRSRSLSDLMSFRAHDLPAKTPAYTELATRVRSLREELNWYYRQIDLQQMRGGERSLAEVKKIRHNAHAKEVELLRALRELTAADQEFSSLQSGGRIDLEAVRSSLPSGALLVEYFIARGTIFGCVVGRQVLEIVPLGAASDTQEIHRRLQFQLSRSMLGPDHVGASGALVEAAIQAHLRGLYEKLVAPIAHHLATEELIVVPHGFLHYLPFHALSDGERYLIDRYSVSYAPSAGVFYLCATKETEWEEKSLVLGVADERAPRIVEEARAVAESLPNATLLLGADASEEALRVHGQTSRIVHIATHGLFRRDNPMFSAIQLGTSRLSLFDLYNLRLGAELVVLSGCGTGLNAVLGADELVGLTRGLLYAGAQSVVVSLWDVNDASTAAFMRRFYLRLAAGERRAEALQQTMWNLRETHPNPYYWAPFVLVGKLG